MNIRPKKSLGQNFLRSKTALSKIIAAAEIKHGEKILEVGPGKGVLTEALLHHGGKVLAVEKDVRLASFLKEKFSEEISSGALQIINSDILELEEEKIFAVDTYKIVANIPYYITGAFLEKFLSSKKQPERIVVMVQKEVADRIVARDGRESILSISVKVFGEPSIVSSVKKESFSPKPKVDSAILLISNISREKIAGLDEKVFFKGLKTGFAHRRKLLSGNLSVLFGKNRAQEILFHCGISKTARPEELALEDWLRIAQFAGDRVI